jgi:hypothetical protein
MYHFRPPHEELIKNIKHDLETDLAYFSPTKFSTDNSKNTKSLVENVIRNMDESPLKIADQQL